MIGVVLSLGEGNATTRFRQSNRWISDCVAARGAGAAIGDAGGRIYQLHLCTDLQSSVGGFFSKG